MFTKIARLGDRMLSRLVPEIEAQAADKICWRDATYDYMCNSYTMAYYCYYTGGGVGIECHYS